MKVKELIKQLERCDPDVDVLAHTMGGGLGIMAVREQKTLKNADPCYLGAMGCVILVTAEWDHYVKSRGSRK